MKKLLIIFIVFVSLGLAMQIVHAQTDSATNSASTTVNLSFPIVQLGNCNSAQACKTYCDDPTHIDACVAYAKAHGFYHPSNLDNQQAAILADAKTTLGCDSVDSCKVFCADPSNATVCSDFAKKHGLSGGTKSPDNTTLQKAEQELGCSSVDSCRAYCQNDANKDRCSAFAKENGLKGGNQTLGPGGCTSEDSCRQYCQKNPAACHMPTPQISVVPLSQHPTQTTLPSMLPADYCRLYPSHCAASPTGQVPTPPLTPNPTYATYCANTGVGCFLNGTHCICPTPTVSQSGSEQLTQTPTPTLKPLTPTPTGTVKGAATHISLWEWFVNQFFHLQ